MSINFSCSFTMKMIEFKKREKYYVTSLVLIWTFENSHLIWNYTHITKRNSWSANKTFLESDSSRSSGTDATILKAVCPRYIPGELYFPRGSLRQFIAHRNDAHLSSLHSPVLQNYIHTCTFLFPSRSFILICRDTNTPLRFRAIRLWKRKLY